MTKFSNIIFYYLSLADDKYVKMKDTTCTAISVDYAVSFSSLISAKNECFQNSSCKGVLDFECNGKDYYLCQIANDYLDSKYGSCVYDKKGMIYCTCILFYPLLVYIRNIYKELHV